jgi:hypothetical protein
MKNHVNIYVFSMDHRFLLCVCLDIFFILFSFFI